MHKDNLHLSSLLKGEQRTSDDSHPSMGSFCSLRWFQVQEQCARTAAAPGRQSNLQRANNLLNTNSVQTPLTSALYLLVRRKEEGKESGRARKMLTSHERGVAQWFENVLSYFTINFLDLIYIRHLYVGNPALNAFSGRFISRVLKSTEIHQGNLEVNNAIISQVLVKQCISVLGTKLKFMRH